MAGCCPCGPNGTSSASGAGGGAQLPLICLVPRDSGAAPGGGALGGGTAGGSRPPQAYSSANTDDVQILDEEYIKAHFDLPPRAMYLDAMRRPLITFPLSQDNGKNFSTSKKAKINQMILDGILDPSEAITAPSVFPYGQTETEKRKQAEDDEEIIYILQLPDYEFTCPIHHQTVRTPRFIWHSCKKGAGKGTDKAEVRLGNGPMNRPKPWLLSRITDFDMDSQW